MDQNYPYGIPGAKKAALLLMSLGKEEAARVMSHLDDKMIENVIAEMSQIRSVSKIEKERILSEFRETIQDLKIQTQGGIETAKEILNRTVGPQKADQILKKIEKKDVSNEFDFLNEVDPKIIYSLISGEGHQTIAVTLAYLQPKKAADVLRLFPSEDQSKIALKLAGTAKSHPEAVIEIAKILKKRYEDRDRSELSEAGGAQSLANILNHMDKEYEDNILKNITEESPDIAHQVKDKLYSFEDIMSLDQKEMRTLLTKVNGNELLTLALRGAGDELKAHFFGSMSQNRASDIIEEMEARGKVTFREINSARTEILKIARRLEEMGLILLKKRKDEFI
ncbi:MAG: flagellar motor switch protein FliG [Leptospiraceae bacterium]|nr:flagellar motor switch protein FliG [Leptospiraceae bacterium]MCP5512269.1 flagellar motor switch protein FliG [Leptospiraceae bacterium]